MNRATLVRAASPRTDVALMRQAAKIIGSHAFWMKHGNWTDWNSVELGPKLQAEYKTMAATAKALRTRAAEIAGELRKEAAHG